MLGSQISIYEEETEHKSLAGLKLQRKELMTAAAALITNCKLQREQTVKWPYLLQGAVPHHIWSSVGLNYDFRD